MWCRFQEEGQISRESQVATSTANCTPGCLGKDWSESPVEGLRDASGRASPGVSLGKRTVIRLQPMIGIGAMRGFSAPGFGTRLDPAHARQKYPEPR